jgi:DNA-binding GntR family transcriptional regulator
MAMLNLIRSDGPEPVARRVFRELRSAIVMMTFRPGQALSEKEIADQFGVSRQPVREAFIKLSETGLLSIRPQRGTYVVKISARQVYDVRFVREAVEVAVVRKAALELPGSAIRALRETVNEQRKVAADERPDRFFPLDEALHRGLALGVGCDYAWRVVEDMKVQMDRVRYLSLPEATPLSRLVDQHAAIVDAVAARDPAQAEAAMRTHLSEILTSLPELAERFPELFEPEPADLADAGTAA